MILEEAEKDKKGRWEEEWVLGRDNILREVRSSNTSASKRADILGCISIKVAKQKESEMEKARESTFEPPRLWKFSSVLRQQSLILRVSFHLSPEAGLSSDSNWIELDLVVCYQQIALILAQRDILLSFSPSLISSLPSCYPFYWSPFQLLYILISKTLFYTDKIDFYLRPLLFLFTLFHFFRNLNI